MWIEVKTINLCQIEDYYVFLQVLDIQVHIPAVRYIMPWNNYMSCCPQNHVVSNFIHNKSQLWSFKMWQTIHFMSYLNHHATNCVCIVRNKTAHLVIWLSCEDYGFACHTMKKWNSPLQSWIAWPRQVKVPSLYYKLVHLAQVLFC